jgi:HD-GYP domain-containing protein (c-di-GMP phosphodiesterase class II)
MHPEVDELRPKLKEILYDCAVEIRATKAALFLFDGTSRFELVDEYGFRGTIRDSAPIHDPLISRCLRDRSAFFVNGLAAEPRLSEVLFETSSDRLLAVPLYLRGQLVGVIDMRDKAGGQPFEKDDLPKGHAIAERFLEVFTTRNIFGQRFISLSEAQAAAADRLQPAAQPSPPRTEAPKPPPAPAVPSQKPETRTRTTAVTSLAALVLEARTAAGRITATNAQQTLGEEEIAAAREVLRSILLIPGALIASFSAFGHLGGVQETAGRSTISDEARSLVQSKLNVWLKKRGEPGGFLAFSTTTPFGTAGGTIGAGDVRKVFTAPLSAGALQGLYLTVGFGEDPDRSAHELLASLHSHLQSVLEASMHRRTLGSIRNAIADKLVEPDFTRFPELRRHVHEVSRLSEAFARHLGLSAAEVENARLLGIVHDCGMRLLDYHRLYRKRDLTAEELAFLREHPTVGAALVEPLLGAELAWAVLCHHERVDGRGYPNALEGEQVPLLSRLLQICDAWVAMTDPQTYQPPEPPEAALATIDRAAGTQFDSELARRFGEMMRARGRG